MVPGHSGMNDDVEEDTDTKLAMLASLLEPATFPIEDLLEALQKSQGDVGKSAESLLLPRVKSAGKRKAGTSLQGWLGKKQAYSSGTRATKTGSTFSIDESESDTTTTSTALSSGSRTTMPRPSPTKNNEKPVDLLSILKQPTAAEKPKNVPRPPLHLPNQPSIDSHALPLTLLSSPLSPQFASALYLTMMEESQTWERNRFYLAGKWVESPHTVCHYARDPPKESEQVEMLEGKEGKKATYMWSGQEIAPSRVSSTVSTFHPCLHLSSVHNLIYDSR